eukprot:5893976-Pyramimonas_sp.AAC.1
MLLIIKTDAISKFLEEKLPKGVFCNYQQSKIMPRWFKQRQDESVDEYWNRVVAAAATVAGRLLYRPSDDAPLGVLSEKQ